MFKHTLSLVASATLVASLGADTLQIEPIAITSNAIETNELQAPYATEIYTSKEIEASHSINIYEFFNQHTSLITSSGYGNSFAQKLDVHGYGIGDGYQNIVVTINGRRLNNIDMTSQLLGSIPLSTIEKIEILKGAGSVMYGDGANAAVINIITKQGDHNELGFYAGNYHSLGQSLYLSSAKERYSYALHLDHFDTDGTRVIDAEGNRDSQKSTNGGVELSYKATDSLEVHANAGFAKNDSFYGRPMTILEYNENPAQEGSAGFGSTQQQFKSNVLGSGLIYTLNNNYSLEIDGSREVKQSNYITYNSIANYRYNELRAQVNYTDDAIKATLGTSGTWGKREGYGNITTKDNSSLYLSSELHLGDHTFIVGGRTEKVTYDYQSTTASKFKDDTLYAAEAGYAFNVSKNSSFFTNYAHSFQAPDIDRFFNWGGAFNGFIEPMKSDTYTIGYTLITPKNKFKTSIFYANLSNEIYYYSDPAWMNSKNTNIDKSHKYGLDLSDQWVINEQFNLSANYNYVQALIDTEQQNGEVYDGNHLPGVSDHNIKATFSYLPNTNTTLALTQIYRSQAYAQEDFANNFTQKQDAYKSTNISVTYAKDNYEMFAKINNLFDQSNGIWINNDEIYPIDFTTTFTAGLKFIF
ncbi:MAG: TonB-dependent receptor [Sulfuricurvum sp.]|nr:TonB-dependent receptor [Sulfuricurvum sp.]